MSKVRAIIALIALLCGAICVPMHAERCIVSYSEEYIHPSGGEVEHEAESGFTNQDSLESEGDEGEATDNEDATDDERDEPLIKVLAIEFIEGETILLPAAKMPRVINHVEEVEIATMHHSVFYPWGNLYKLSMKDATKEEVAAEVEGIPADVPGDILYRGDILILEGFKPGAKVIVATLEGRVIKQFSTESAERTIIDLSNLDKGIYIVNADRHSIKIQKR